MNRKQQRGKLFFFLKQQQPLFLLLCEAIVACVMSEKGEDSSIEGSEGIITRARSGETPKNKNTAFFVTVLCSKLLHFCFALRLLWHCTLPETVVGIHFVFFLRALVFSHSGTQFVREDDYEAVSSSEDSDSSDDSESVNTTELGDEDSWTKEDVLQRYKLAAQKLRQAKNTISSLIEQVTRGMRFRVGAGRKF